MMSKRMQRMALIGVPALVIVTALIFWLQGGRHMSTENAFVKADIAQIASEVLSLTKINWNSTQMNQKLPIPIRAARNVGEVLKYVTDDRVSADYRRYI